MTTLSRGSADVFVAGTHVHTREYQAFRILQLAFMVAPVVAGIDKFFNSMVSWDQYVLAWIPSTLGLSAHRFMMIVGVIEIIAGIGVAAKPKIFAYVVSGWMAGIVINLLLTGMYYDIALRDLGLCLAAFCLGRLAHDYDTGLFGGLLVRRMGSVKPTA